MQSEIQTETTERNNENHLISEINKIDTAWYKVTSSSSSESERCLEPFGNIDSQTIERFFKSYQKSDFDTIYRQVVLGMSTIDVKSNNLYHTNDPRNTKCQHLVVRGTSHIRKRPINARFFGMINDALKLKEMTKLEASQSNKIGKKWIKQFNKGKMPSFPQVKDGIIKEALVQLNLTIEKLKTKDQEKALENIETTWNDLFRLIKAEGEDG